MRGWMEQYRVAVDAVQDQVFDVQMAKASREELEALHRVLQAEGLAGLTAAAEALELEALHRALLEGGAARPRRGGEADHPEGQEGRRPRGQKAKRTCSHCAQPVPPILTR